MAVSNTGLTAELYEECLKATQKLLHTMQSFDDPLEVLHDALVQVEGEITHELVMTKVRAIIYTNRGQKAEISSDLFAGKVKKRYIESDRMCIVCKNPFPQSEFLQYTQKNGRIRIDNRCKSCKSVQSTQSQAKKPLYYKWQQKIIGQKKYKKRKRLIENEKKTGKLWHTCKNCGPLPISEFSVMEKTPTRLRNACRSCESKRIAEIQRKKAEKKHRPYSTQKASKQKGRENLSDNYIKCLLRERGYKKEQITSEVMQQVRESILLKRYKREQKKGNNEKK